MTSPYRKRYNDPYQIESDHKDVVISQLKAEAFELRQGERDYEELNARMNNLNHRFNLLKDEKSLDEREYSTRTELNHRTINNLKDDIEGLRSEYRSIEADILDLRGDNQSINGIISVKSSEIAKFKTELADIINENEELTINNKDLDRLILRNDKENKECAIDNETLNAKADQAAETKAKNEKIIRQLEGDVERSLKINDQLKGDQEDLKAKLREKGAIIREAEHNVAENKKRIIALESRLADRKRINEKLNVEIKVAAQEEQEENIRAEKQTEKARTLQDAVADKDSEIEDLKRQVAELRKEKLQVLDDNDALNNDIKAAHRHLDTLTVQHYELIDQIDKINTEDGEIRSILERRERISKVTTGYQDKLKVSTTKFNSSLQSPVRTASTKAEDLSA
jgi:chromosome segregation ATPase